MFSLQRQTSERVSKSDAFNAKVSHPSRTVVYPKLEVTEPGDHDEQEADAVANDVMSGKICRQISHGSVGGGMSVSSQMEGRLNSLQGGGQAMPDGLRSMMERGFNRDFSQVRLHTDSEAASLSSSIHAKAFTHGNDIYFNQGQFSPNTSEGQKLMAHELTHVVQGGEKVGRMPDDKKKKRLHYNINYYIEEIDWIKDKVLGSERYEKFISNYKETSDRVPVTVVLFTTKKSSDGAFERSLDSLFQYFENNEDGKKILMIQGQPNMFGHKLIDIAVSYGPIENVIVAGHGSPWTVDLGEDSKDEHYIIDSFDKNIFANIAYAFNLSDKEQKGLKHSVLFDECLVGSKDTDGDRSFIDYAYTKINDKMRKSKVFVRGNKSATWNDSVYYRDEDGYLKFKNMIDDTTTIDGKHLSDSSHHDNPQSYNNDNPQNPYAKTGKETKGILLSNIQIAYEPMDHLNFCSSDLGNREFMDELGRRNSLYLGHFKIRTRFLVEFIESKHCNISNMSTDFSHLKEFLIFLNDKNRYDKNKNYTQLDEGQSLAFFEYIYENFNQICIPF